MFMFRVYTSWLSVMSRVSGDTLFFFFFFFLVRMVSGGGDGSSMLLALFFILPLEETVGVDIRPIIVSSY